MRTTFSTLMGSGAALVVYGLIGIAVEFGDVRAQTAPQMPQMPSSSSGQSPVEQPSAGQSTRTEFPQDSIANAEPNTGSDAGADTGSDTGSDAENSRREFIDPSSISLPVSSSPTLDDLIPEAATQKPLIWAQEGAGNVSGADGENGGAGAQSGREQSANPEGNALASGMDGALASGLDGALGDGLSGLEGPLNISEQALLDTLERDAELPPLLTQDNGAAAQENLAQNTGSQSTGAQNTNAPSGSDGSTLAAIGQSTSDQSTSDQSTLGQSTLGQSSPYLVPWPDNMQLPEFTPLPPDEMGLLAAQNPAPLPEYSASRIVPVSSGLVLSLPADTRNFPRQDEFVQRFAALSAVEEFSGDNDDLAKIAARARKDRELLMQMTRAYGYYDAQVISNISGRNDAPSAGGAGYERGNGAVNERGHEGGNEAGDGGNGQGAENSDAARGNVGNGALVRFDILPGLQYTIGRMDLGKLDEAPDHLSLRENFVIKEGDPLNSDVIEDQVETLKLGLAENGYPFARVSDPALIIDHRELTGDLDVQAHPGGKYVFVGVTSSLPDFLSGEHLASISRFEVGDVIKQSLIDDLQRAIVSTRLTSSVRITPRRQTKPAGNSIEDAPGEAVLDIALTEGKLRTIAAAAGYGTEEGVRLEVNWEHRNLFPPEGALKLRGVVGTKEQLAGITFRKNNFGGRDRVLTADLYASTLDSDAFDARTVGFVASYERISTLFFQKGLSWNVGIEAIASSERAPDVNGVRQARDTYFIGALPVGALVDRSDSLLDPKEGFRMGLRFSPEISRTNNKSDNYLRSQFDLSSYKSVNDNVVMAARMRFGSIIGTELGNIAPSRRLYSGGGGSVRGYGYQQIGPRDEEGEPTGGRSVVEFALEARIRTGFFDGALSVVPFIDAGSVSRRVRPDFDQVRYGAGAGIRYDTGFGPIRVDVGVPLNPGPDDNPVAVYVSLGQAF